MAGGRGVQQDTTDSVDFAMGRSRGSAEARSLLEWQARLVETQETLARADLRHRGWQIISERVGAVLKGLTALVGIILLLTIAAFLWSASQARGMVVDAFSVPPALNQRGMTGAVVAGQLLDKVSALETSTQSARAASSYENSWADTEGVAVPYAGVSLGQLRRETRAWLGSETHLQGEVVQLGGDRVAIAFRAGGIAGRVEGTSAEFDALLQQAAVQIFKATQPYRYHVWLGRNGGSVAESRAILTELSRSPDLKERLWAMHGLAMRASTDAEYIAIYERALRLRPDFLPAVGNMAYITVDLGHEEEGLRRTRIAAAAYAKGQEDYNKENADGFALVQESRAAELTGDQARRVEALRKSLEFGADASNAAWRPFLVAYALADQHDFAAAGDVLAASGMTDPVRRAKLETEFGPFPTNRELHARATGDHATLAAVYGPLFDRLAALVAGPATNDMSKRDAESTIRSARLQYALALARSGRAAQAQSVIAPAAADHDPSLRARALIAAYAGDHRRSDALFASAVARSPSLPRGHLMWAEALLLRGDTGRAIAQAELAHGKGPRWAEPLKLWGDALLRRRDWAGAEGKYAAAAERAPRWGKLHLEWANALWAAGRSRDARLKLRAAATMDLSSADRARLQTMSDKARTRA